MPECFVPFKVHLGMSYDCVGPKSVSDRQNGTGFWTMVHILTWYQVFVGKPILWTHNGESVGTLRPFWYSAQVLIRRMPFLLSTAV